MTDFVVYHNTDQMGELTDSGEWLSVFTDKSHLDVLGERIWLIVGEGQPRKYYLGMWLRAEAVEPDATGAFSTEIKRRGRVLGRDERPVLNDESWFGAFLRRQGNFGLGLNTIGDTSVERELKRLAERAELGNVWQADRAIASRPRNEDGLVPTTAPPFRSRRRSSRPPERNALIWITLSSRCLRRQPLWPPSNHPSGSSASTPRCSSTRSP